MSVQDGRRPIGIGQPPGSNNDYPFVEPSSDIDRLLADFYLVFSDDLCAHPWPLRVAWLYGFGTNPNSAPAGYPSPAHAYDLLIVDADGATVFDSTEAETYATYPWANRLLIIEWQTDTAICRCVLHTAWSANDTPLTYDLFITPDNGTLDPRTWERMPRRVLGLRVGDQIFTGDVVLDSGYNIALSGAANKRSDGKVFSNRISVQAQPGDGLGRLPGCEETVPLIRRINGISPDATGRFFLQADDCFRAQLPLHAYEGDLSAGRTFGADTFTAPTWQMSDWYDPALVADRVLTYGTDAVSAAAARAGIVLFNDCQPCCSCDDFVNTYQGLKAMWQRWKDAGVTLEQARDQYSVNRQRWLDQLACRQANTLRGVGMPESDCKLFLGAAYCNMTSCCMVNPEIRFTLRLYINNMPSTHVLDNLTQLSDAYVNDSSTDGDKRYLPHESGWPVTRFWLNNIDPQATAVAKFRLCLPACQSNWSVKAYVTFHANDPLVDNDGNVCTLPQLNIPADVNAIWRRAGVPEGPVLRAIVSNVWPVSPTIDRSLCNCGG